MQEWICNITVILNWIWKLTTGKNYVKTGIWCYGLWHCRVFQVDTNILDELDASSFRITDLKMKALCLSTISVSTYQILWCDSPKDHYVNTECHKYLKIYNVILLLLYVVILWLCGAKWQWTMNKKGDGRKQPCPNLRYYPAAAWRDCGKLHKMLAGIWTRYPHRQIRSITALTNLITCNKLCFPCPCHEGIYGK